MVLGLNYFGGQTTLWPQLPISFSNSDKSNQSTVLYGLNYFDFGFSTILASFRWLLVVHVVRQLQKTSTTIPPLLVPNCWTCRWFGKRCGAIFRPQILIKINNRFQKRLNYAQAQVLITKISLSQNGIRWAKWRFEKGGRGKSVLENILWCSLLPLRK